MSVASHQSEELNDPASLLARAQELSKAGPLPRPAHFAVYCLYPLQVEFWGASANRLHRRLRYGRTESSWSIHWLQP
ncbi:pyridoxine 5'-phosphate oxidase C-terminal domain-containing protein [Citrobacter freundii]|uniref:pyridoxine 5'-phosphate oxidase C-terminal domain-containing protein n=2 Tax=Enterobacterales TaxID=91347 RepID=UPI003F4AAB37